MHRGLLRSALIAIVTSFGILGAAGCDSGAASGGACVTNANCPSGEQCIGRKCVAASKKGCETEDDCRLGQSCNPTTHACEDMQVTGCTNDDACPPDQRCNTNTRVCIVGRRSCTGDAQCTSIGKHCDTTLQQCVDCRVATDCQSPQTCVDGACVDPSTTTCQSDLGCNAPTTVCVNQACVPGCQRTGSPVECGPGQLCDSSTGRCRAGQVTCSNDSSCAPPSTVCESGQCIPGCTQIGGLQCTGGNTCNVSTGRCQPPSGCTTDAQCGAPNQVCESSRCVPGCGQPNGLQCTGTNVCNASTGRCGPGTTRCSLDSQCGPPTHVCEGGQCIPGCTQVGGLQCTGGQVCSSGTGRCSGGTTSCTSDASCAPPSTICNTGTGMCVAGCGTTGCSGGQTCGSNGRCTGGSGGGQLDSPCSANADCASSVCMDFGGQVGGLCVSSCGSSADCPIGFTCYHYDGAKLCVSAVHFGPSTTFSTPSGGSCGGASECRSNFCPGSTCIDTCSENGDCAPLDCQWSEVVTDLYIGSCQGPAGLGTNGASCAQDADCRSGVCYGTGTCGDLCGSTADCPADSVCSPVNYSICQLDYGSCYGWQPNVVKACVQATHGNGAIGSSCTTADSCRSGLCYTPTSECTDTCSRDSDCLPSQVCGVEQVGSLPEGSGNDVPLYTNVCKGRGL